MLASGGLEAERPGEAQSMGDLHSATCERVRRLQHDLYCTAETPTRHCNLGSQATSPALNCDVPRADRADRVPLASVLRDVCPRSSPQLLLRRVQIQSDCSSDRCHAFEWQGHNYKLAVPR